MDYKVRVVKDGQNEHKQHGYKLFEDDKQSFSVWMQNGKPDNSSWAILLPYYPYERDMPVFTKEHCAYQGTPRDHYDTITIIDEPKNV